MPARERALAVVQEWVEKAESDLAAAMHLLKLGAKSPTEVVCIHVQQCAENI